MLFGLVRIICAKGRGCRSVGVNQAGKNHARQKSAMKTMPSLGVVHPQAGGEPAPASPWSRVCIEFHHALTVCRPSETPTAACLAFDTTRS
jgi:hypothetical protein